MFYKVIKFLFQPLPLSLFLYTCIGMFTFMEGYLSTEEAYKYCPPTLLFWLKLTIGALGAGAASAKMVLSTTYAEHIASRKASNSISLGGTEQPTKTTP